MKKTCLSILCALLVHAAASHACSITAGGIVNSAGFNSNLAIGSLATIFGSDLAGGSVTVNGVAATVSLAAATQINFRIPSSGVAIGSNRVDVVAADNTFCTANATIGAVGPGLFASNSQGFGQAADQVTINGSVVGQDVLPIFISPNQVVSIDFFATGLQTLAGNTVGVTIGSHSYLGVVSTNGAGLDHVVVTFNSNDFVNVFGAQNVTVNASGITSNTVTVTFQ